MNKERLTGFKSMRSGLLCNHTAWDFETGYYLFDQLPNLQRIFVPEHGLFAELQDQVPLSGDGVYKDFGIDTEIISLYGYEESTLSPTVEMLRDLDLLIVDLQDTGARYFTFGVTLGYMMKAIIEYSPDVNVVILDRENPAGLQIEGSKLPESFSSFIGWPGLPHRHGLTLAELSLFFYKQLSAKFPLYILPVKNQIARADFDEFHPPNVSLIANEAKTSPARQTHAISQSRFIPPSPNIPGLATPYLYSGQCLLEGTNLSEGRGTTRPFEQFGAPWLHSSEAILNDNLFMKFPGAGLRPVLFRPTFHKWNDEICHGFFIHLTGEPYHSLLHSLYLIRTIREHFPEFSWREGSYEFGSYKTAIELLAGDSILLNYLEVKTAFKNIQEYLMNTEKSWLNEMKSYKIYERTNISILNPS